MMIMSRKAHPPTTPAMTAEDGKHAANQSAVTVEKVKEKADNDIKTDPTLYGSYTATSISQKQD